MSRDPTNNSKYKKLTELERGIGRVSIYYIYLKHRILGVTQDNSLNTTTIPTSLSTYKDEKTENKINIHLNTGMKYLMPRIP